MSLMDLQTGEWTQGFPLTFKLVYPNFIAISSIEVFVCGGTPTGGPYNTKSWIYNIETGNIDEKATSSVTAYGSNCALFYLKMKAKKVIFCAGNRNPKLNKAEIYDIQENKWELVPEFDMIHHVDLARVFVFGDR